MFRPLWTLSEADKAKLAHDFDHRYDRPTPDDYEWLDMVQNICDTRQTDENQGDGGDRN